MKKGCAKLPFQSKSGIKESSRISTMPLYTGLLVNRACTAFLISRGLMPKEGNQWAAQHAREIAAKGRRKK